MFGLFEMPPDISVIIHPRNVEALEKVGRMPGTKRGSGRERTDSESTDGRGRERKGLIWSESDDSFL